MDYNNKTCLVYDYGSFFYIAQRLAEDFGKVLYCVPSEGAFPKLERDSIGRGFENIIRVDENEYRRMIDSIDLFVFPDVGNDGEQFDLRKRGKRVFGCGDAERLEQDRQFFKQTLDKAGLPTIKYRGKFFKEVTGIDALKAEMQKEKDFWVKISKFRGLGETFHHIDWATSATWFYELAHELGDRRDTFTFSLEDSVKAVEIGHDSFFSAGKFLDKCLVGIESKDAGYSCRVTDYRSIPSPLKVIDEKMAPTLAAMGVMGAMSTEVRVVNDKLFYWNDATMRFGIPPSDIECRIWKNFSEIVWCVAGGEPVTPTESYKYGASIYLYTEYVMKEPTPITFPDKYKDRVMLQRPYKKGDQIIIIPQNKGDVLGSVVGLGKTREAAEINALEIAESVKALGIRYDKGVFETIDEYAAEASKLKLEVFK